MRQVPRVLASLAALSALVAALWASTTPAAGPTARPASRGCWTAEGGAVRDVPCPVVERGIEQVVSVDYRARTVTLLHVPRDLTWRLCYGERCRTVQDVAVWVTRNGEQK